MNIGNKNSQSRSSMGVKQSVPLFSMGHKIFVGNNTRNWHKADTSAGIHNESNSNAVAREPMRGIAYKPVQRQPHIEKTKKENNNYSKFA